jgi:signal peptidase I
MRGHPGRFLLSIAGVALVAILWVFFAPTAMGGSTTYSVTSGISMQPMLHRNDLAFVRAQSSYHVGEVVLYESPVLHRQVLHRIIVVQNGDYYFKGDNNHFVDPGYATRAELLGKLWLHIPKVGAGLRWFGDPAHSSALAGITVMLVVIASAGTQGGARRRKSRRRRPPRLGFAFPRTG